MWKRPWPASPSCPRRQDPSPCRGPHMTPTRQPLSRCSRQPTPATTATPQRPISPQIHISACLHLLFPHNTAHHLGHGMPVMTRRCSERVRAARTGRRSSRITSPQRRLTVAGSDMSGLWSAREPMTGTHVGLRGWPRSTWACARRSGPHWHHGLARSGTLLSNGYVVLPPKHTSSLFVRCYVLTELWDISPCPAV